MGRFFSTVYRLILVAVGGSALVLSILSATSCSFVKFDHQYKTDGRFLNNVGLERRVQEPGEPAEGAGSPVEGDVVGPGVGDNAFDDVTNQTEGIGEEGAIGTDTETSALVAAPEPNVAEASESPEGATVTQATTPSTDLSNEDVSVGAPVEDSVASLSTSPTLSPVPAPKVETPTSPVEPTPPTNELVYGSGADVGPSPAEAVDDTTFASAGEDAAATASGYAGLYCNGDQSFSVTNLWGQSVKELADELGSMSDFNQSEEIARGAAVAACMLGLLMAFIVIMESIIGWRICCERWIVSVVAVCACLSQGITFLFFNSERYCDGDIVNEILNQEPCVIGPGGVYSAIATGLYFISVLMSCKLPQDDPYGLCCKKRSVARNSESGSSSGVGSSKFVSLGKSDSDVAPEAQSPEDRNRPNWLSEDKKRDKEENEII